MNLFAQTDEFDVNRHTKTGIIRGQFFRVIFLSDAPKIHPLLHSNLHLLPFQHLKDPLTIGETGNKVSADLHIILEILEESVERLLVLEEVVKGKHTGGHIRMLFQNPSDAPLIRLFGHIGRHLSKPCSEYHLHHIPLPY